MICFHAFKIKISVSFSFLAVIALVSLWQNKASAYLLMTLMCCVLHELGHIFFMCLFSHKPDEIMFYGGGIKIYNNTNRLLSDKADIIILFAGCGVNILIACILILIEREVSFFAAANLFFGLFNLMPVKYFDGGRILSKVFKDSPSVRAIRLVFILAFASTIILMFFNGFVSISLIVTFVYIIFSEFAK